MKVIILAGGYGTRLIEETTIIPKPMIEIGGQPLLWHLMNYFSHYNKREFIVALGYKSEVIKRYFLQYSELQSNLKIDLSLGTVISKKDYSEDWLVELVNTGLETNTGGRLRRLSEYIDGTFIFTYGDGLSNIDINELLKFHKSHGKLATVSAVKPVSRFGLLTIDDNNRVQTFSEKPEYLDDYINGGFFVLEKEVIDYIDGDDTSWEFESCRRLAADGQMMAYHHTGFWQCVDTLHELRHLRNLWSSGKAHWKVWS